MIIVFKTCCRNYLCNTNILTVWMGTQLYCKVQHLYKHSCYVELPFIKFALYNKHSEADQRNTDCKAKLCLILTWPISSHQHWFWDTLSHQTPPVMVDCSSLWNIYFFHWFDIPDSPERIYSLGFPLTALTNWHLKRRHSVFSVT
jgi:hypothetical protein